MKKIYILTAVFALLALSLNAQSQLKVNQDGVIVSPTSLTEQVVQGEKVVTPPDGYFRMGPSRASTTPVTPPYTNEFASNTEWNWWEAIDANSDDKTWTLYNGYARYSYHTSNAANDWLITAPVHLEAGKLYTFSINAWAYSANYPERLQVRMASDHTAEALAAGRVVIVSTDVSTTSTTNTLSNNKVSVSETGDYYFGIHCISDANMYYLYVDNLSIGIGADPTPDLKAYVSAPSQIYAGQTATVAAKVTNTGDIGVNNYTVTIYANGTAISTQSVNQSLEVGESKMFYAQHPTTDAGTVNYTATVTYTGDADATNDNATASMSVIALPAPVNVAATDGDHNSTVTWKAPTITPITVTEDFENIDVFEPFSVGGITATQHTGAFGDWKLYDSTGANVWGSQQEDFPNESEPQAWMPYSPIALGSDVEAYSGDQYMESICPLNTTTATNSWLISPELSGNAQTITFWERVLGNYGNEKYEVLASSTDNNPSSFTSVQTFEDAVLTWTQRSVVLPEGTKYFAIRHYSTDIFGLLIDDITYEVAGEQPVSYNVYLDGVLQGNVDSNTFSYNFSNVEYGEHTCAISAVYADDLKSELVSDTFVSAAKTATPTITYQVTNGTVVITATGDGDITLSAGGQTAYGQGTATITIVRSPESRTVKATATAKEENKAESDPATEDITIPALEGTSSEPAEGLLRLHLLILDQLKQEIPADNSHPERYGYVLRYEPNGPEGEGVKESGTVDVTIQKTDCTVEGKYTLEQIDEDTDRGLTMGIYSADVEFMLSETNPDIDFYMLQREDSKNTEAGFSYVTKLQQTTNFTYVEMLPGSAHEGDEYLAGPHYFNDEVLTGTYGDYVRYAPVVSTWGIQRRYYEDDGLDNTYGAPLWKTGVGKVTMSSATAERQKNVNNSVNWTDEEGKAASLYILNNVTAVGELPDYSTVEYEPYMFRIFVESPSGKLRNYKVIEGGDGQYDGEHLAASATSEADKHGPICVWSGYIKDMTEGNPYGMMLGTTGNKYTFTKNKVDRAGGSTATNPQPSEWDKDAVNAMFGALDALATTGEGESATISEDDLKIFVRFYYNVKGMAEGHNVTSNNNRSSREDSDDPVGYGAESDAMTPNPATAVDEIHYLGEVESQIYYNVQGMQSDKPFDGVNIVVTRFSDGTTSVTKVVR